MISLAQYHLPFHVYASFDYRQPRAGTDMVGKGIHPIARYVDYPSLPMDPFRGWSGIETIETYEWVPVGLISRVLKCVLYSVQ